MKWFFRLSMIFLSLLTACSSSGSSAECKKGICVSIEIKESVQALEPVLFTITVKTDKDISGLGLSLYGDVGITIQDIVVQPKQAVVGYQDKRSMDWEVDTKGGEEYIFSGHLIFPKPTVSYGIYACGLIVAASQPSINRVTDSITIYLDPSGKQVEESMAIMKIQTDYPVPTLLPNLTIVPEATNLIDVWPSITPSPSPTPTITLPAYPNP